MQNKADSQEIKVGNAKKKDIFALKVTEENDVTSTTCDELDQNISEHPSEFEEPQECKQLKEIGQPKECELTPKKLLDNEVVTSTPIKLTSDNTTNIISQDFEIVQNDASNQQKRKRGRPRKSKETTQINTKRIKVDEITGISEMEDCSTVVTGLTPEVASSRPVSSRSLRTSKVVNYGSLSEKLVTAQKLESNLPIRKRSTVRCETVL